jgi:CO/xanthine dehydrogenase Mo-binding subunit
LASRVSAKAVLSVRAAAILSAVNDALRTIGAEVHDLPLTPVRILDAISAGRASRSTQS